MKSALRHAAASLLACIVGAWNLATFCNSSQLQLARDRCSGALHKFLDVTDLGLAADGVPTARQLPIPHMGMQS